MDKDKTENIFHKKKKINILLVSESIYFSHLLL